MPTRFREIELQVGLSTRLMGYVAAGVLITSAVVGVVRVQKERGHLSDLIDRSGQSVANATASGAASLIAGYDYGNLELLARNVAHQANVSRVMIRNQAGRPMAQSSSNESDRVRRYAAPVAMGDETLGSVVVDVPTDVLENALRGLYWRIFSEQLIFGAVLVLIVYLFTAYGIVSPIRRLTRAMEDAVGKGGAFVAQDLEVRSQDEIGRLVAVFNTLNRSLASYHHQLMGKIDYANQELAEKNAQLLLRTQELERALEMVNTMATTDCLTELPNRRKFDEALSRMFHQSARFSEDITLVLFDIDRFKNINDSYGHAAGDQVLRDIATLLGLHVRKSDQPARLGGDEFGVVLYHTGTAQAGRFVEKLMDSVHKHVTEYEGFEIRVGISAGIAQYTESMRTPQALYHAADKALYQSKRDGRGRYTAYCECMAYPEIGTS